MRTTACAILINRGGGQEQRNMDERLLQIARCDTIADVKECIKVLLGLYVRFNKVLVTKKNVSARGPEYTFYLHMEE